MSSDHPPRELSGFFHLSFSASHSPLSLRSGPPSLERYSPQNPIPTPNVSNPPHNVIDPPCTETDPPIYITNLTLNITRTKTFPLMPEVHLGIEQIAQEVRVRPSRSIVRVWVRLNPQASKRPINAGLLEIDPTFIGPAPHIVSPLNPVYNVRQRNL
jgi:hypothetical protein